MPSAQSTMEDQYHSTIPDPRIASPGPQREPSDSSSTHPDLDHEVATLSTKLINALNHQTSLDDTLTETRHELEAARERVRELESTVSRQQEILGSDIWVRRKNVESEKTKLITRIVEEKKLRAEVEKDKKKIEQELENLTVSLFEEANKMVITAKEEAKAEQEALHRKNEQLRGQLADTEGLLKSQQEQLFELKLVMEQITTERGSHTTGTAPSSPGLSKFDIKEEDYRLAEGSPQCESPEAFPPTHPTSLAHLVQPVLRNDISCYDDFAQLAKVAKSQPGSRVSSGSFTGLTPGLGHTAQGHQSNPSNASSAAGSASGHPSPANLSPQTPNTPSTLVASGPAVPVPTLKETKFFKRTMTEDVEPTLRLDLAPGLSWLARRSVINAMIEGTLVVEPVPANSPFATISKPQFYPCSLCGEKRTEVPYLRNHRFRTSESGSAQRYPLCKYCLGRVRSTCGFLGFLRMVKEGHWPTGDDEAERGAWEESVRLREHMFWSRIGGGVIPAQSSQLQTPDKSTRTSHDIPRISTDQSQSHHSINIAQSEHHDALHLAGQSPPSPVEAGTSTAPAEPTAESETATHDQTTTEPEPADPKRDAVSRLSVFIPGAFGLV